MNVELQTHLDAELQNTDNAHLDSEDNTHEENEEFPDGDMHDNSCAEKKTWKQERK